MTVQERTDFFKYDFPEKRFVAVDEIPLHWHDPP